MFILLDITQLRYRSYLLQDLKTLVTRFQRRFEVQVTRHRARCHEVEAQLRALDFVERTVVGNAECCFPTL
jgi:hypothetical protein